MEHLEDYTNSYFCKHNDMVLYINVIAKNTKIFFLVYHSVTLASDIGLSAVPRNIFVQNFKF